MPLIASRYLDMWKGFQLSFTGEDKSIKRRCFQPGHLETIENDFPMMLCCSNIIGRLEVLNDSLIAKQSIRSSDRSAFRSGAVSVHTDPDISSQQPPTPSNASQRVNRVSPSESGSPGTLSDSLRKRALLCTFDGTILWAKVSQLASIELMIHLADEKDMPCEDIEDDMEKKGVPLPNSIQPLDLCDMNVCGLSNASANIADASNDLMEHLGKYFTPDDDELLFEWLCDGKAYSSRRLSKLIFGKWTAGMGVIVSDTTLHGSYVTFSTHSTFQPLLLQPCGRAFIHS